MAQYLPGRFERQVEEGLTYVAATPRFIGGRHQGNWGTWQHGRARSRSLGPLRGYLTASRPWFTAASPRPLLRTHSAGGMWRLLEWTFGATLNLCTESSARCCTAHALRRSRRTSVTRTMTSECAAEPPSSRASSEPSDSARTPRIFRSDRYALAHFVTHLALASQFNCLEAVGVDAARLLQLRAWASKVSLDQLWQPGCPAST